MPDKNFYIVIDDIFNNTYLIQKVLSNFSTHPAFLGILFRSENQHLLQDRINLHKLYKGQKALSEEVIGQFERLYGSLTTAAKEMIKRYGVPELDQMLINKANFAGNNLNSAQTEFWLQAEVEKYCELDFFISIDQILKPFWIKYAKVINAHPAVLPFARGMCALEQTVAKGDLEEVKKVVGATVHFIDEGVDTGDIIVARRITDPFSSNSLADLKGRCYILSFDMLVEVIYDRLSNCDSELVGITPNNELIGPNYFIKNFTSELENIAEKTFENMKNSQSFCKV